MSYTITDCQGLEPGRLCAAMNEAFADYPVPLSKTVDKFVDFQKQRGFSAEFSFVARQGDDIAAFWFSTVPLGAYAGRAYTVSVGTLPAHRRKGLSRQLLKAVAERQQNAAAKGLQLEVMHANEKAVQAYRTFGFVDHRPLRVCRVPLQVPGLQGAPSVTLEKVAAQDLPQDESVYFDTLPTPQNCREALKALGGKVHLVGAREGRQLLGWAAIYPDGALAQIAVHKVHRRKGIGTSLLSALKQAIDADFLRFVNVDAGSIAVNAFMDKAGAEDLLYQQEMHLVF